MKTTKNMISYAIVIFITLFISAYYVGKEVAMKENIPTQHLHTPNH
jgi:hypothetical protein